jgi:hypothetical protein
VKRGGVARAAALALGLSACGRTEPPPPAETLYTFHREADALLGLFFPRMVRVAGHTAAYASRTAVPRFQSLDESIMNHHIASSETISNAPVDWDRGPDHLESSWLHRITGEEGCSQLLAGASDAERLARDFLRGPLRFRSVVEKAFFQRDLYQMGSLLLEASAASASDPARRALEAIADLLVSLRLGEDEYSELVRLRSLASGPGGTTQLNAYDLSRDYLPKRVFSADERWIEIPFAPDETRHFRSYRGRSFFKVYLSAPGWNAEKLRTYWDEIHAKFGVGTAHFGPVPRLPAGTEVLLIRSFGVHLRTGEYVDSGFPEEVILRAFRFEMPELDPGSSDYRGTYLYQYKTRRSRLFSDPSGLGLTRIRDDDPSFFGFYGDSPDETIGVPPKLTTMRNSCISCHSEMYYGIQTVFSLARARPRGNILLPRSDGLLVPASGLGRFRLRDRFSGFVESRRK